MDEWWFSALSTAGGIAIIIAALSSQNRFIYGEVIQNLEKTKSTLEIEYGLLKGLSEISHITTTETANRLVVGLNSALSGLNNATLHPNPASLMQAAIQLLNSIENRKDEGRVRAICVGKDWTQDEVKQYKEANYSAVRNKQVRIERIFAEGRNGRLNKLDEQIFNEHEKTKDRV